MSEFKSDIFAFFDAMNAGDFRYVDEMSDEEVKGLSPYVLSMWVNGATGTEAPNHVIITDMVCNDKIFTLQHNPRLLLKLFVAANCGMGSTRFKFKKNSVSKESKYVKMIADYYECGLHEAKQYLRLLSEKELKGLEAQDVK